MSIMMLSFLLGMILSGVWFGSTYVLKLVLNGSKYPTLLKFSGALSAFIPTIAILFLNEQYLLNMQKIGDWHWWIASLFSAVIAALIIFQNPIGDLPQGKELIWYGFEGAMMEIPQRLMMQSFVWCILRRFGTEDALYISIPITALIWCISILIQNLIFRVKFSIQTIREILASAFFSISVGYILAETMCLLFPMAAHFSERIISTLLRVYQTRRYT